MQAKDDVVHATESSIYLYLEKTPILAFAFLAQLGQWLVEHTESIDLLGGHQYVARGLEEEGMEGGDE